MKNAPSLLWAALATPAVFLSLAGSDAFSRTLAEKSGLKISPRFTGGEIVAEIEHGGYKALLHRPVFDGIAGERDTGFIQVDWRPLPALPPALSEEIPLPGGGSFRLNVETATGRASCEGGGGRVLCDPSTARAKNALTVRVKLSRRRG